MRVTTKGNGDRSENEGRKGKREKPTHQLAVFLEPLYDCFKHLVTGPRSAFKTQAPDGFCRRPLQMLRESPCIP